MDYIILNLNYKKRGVKTPFFLSIYNKLWKNYLLLLDQSLFFNLENPPITPIITQTTAIITAAGNNHVVILNIDVNQLTTPSVIDEISELSRATVDPETVNWLKNGKTAIHNAGTNANVFFISVL